MPRKKKRDDGEHIDRKREKAGYASTKFDWQPKTGHAFRERIKGGVPFPPMRKPDIFK